MIQVPIEKQIWTAEQVGDYLGVCARQVREHYAKRPDFPGLFRLGSGRRSPVRWKAEDIINWALKQ